VASVTPTALRDVEGMRRSHRSASRAAAVAYSGAIGRSPPAMPTNPTDRSCKL
jgi:hypothetical protein